MLQTVPLPTDPLQIDQVWQLVRNHHPELAQARLKARIAWAKWKTAQGAFDPRWVNDARALRYNSSDKRGDEKEGVGFLSQVEWLTRFGAKLFTGGEVNYGDVKSPLSSTGQTGTYFAGVDVPLLRGARVNRAAAAEQTAQLAIQEQEALVTLKQLELLGKATKAYWDWWSACQKLAVYENLLTLAEQRFFQVQKRAQAGDLPTIDVAEAQQAVQMRRRLVAEWQQNQQLAAVSLASFLWQSPRDAMAPPTRTLCPSPQTLVPIAPLPDETQLATAVMEAVRQRPEFAALDWQTRQVEVDRAVARNLRLPGLDLYVRPGVDTGEDSVGPVITAGVRVMVPLRNRTAEGLLAAAEWSLEQLELQQWQQLQAYFLSVQGLSATLTTSWQQWEAAQQEQKLALQVQQGEQTRFNLGDSTLFLVNQREQLTAAAQLQVIEAEKQYRAASDILRITLMQLP